MQGRALFRLITSAFLLLTAGCQEILNFISPEELIEMRNRKTWGACSKERIPSFAYAHRLNNRELRNTLRDLSGSTQTFVSDFPLDQKSHGFDTNAYLHSFTEAYGEKLFGAAESVANVIIPTSGTGGILNCNPATTNTTAVNTCVTQVLGPFASRAYRRPSTAQEITRFQTLVRDQIAAGDTLHLAMRAGVTAILVSPKFIYRLELDPDPNSEQARDLTGYELASRMSYFIWGSIPDSQLTSAAANGALLNETVLVQQVDRMLSDSKSQELTNGFGAQWLGLAELESVTPSTALFPQYSTQVRDGMMQETLLYFDHFVDNALPVGQMLTSKFTYLNQNLAQFYGIPGVAGTNYRWVSTQGTPRTGLLSQGSILTLTSQPNKTSPIRRGVWALETLMCQPPPAPPPGVEADLPPPEPGMSVREVLAMHRSNPTCAACHNMMDPIGLGLENFNAVGLFRSQDESGNTIDSSGELVNGSTFIGASELGTALAEQDQFRQCMTEHLMRYAVGRSLTSSDNCEIDEIAGEIKGTSDDTLKGIIRRIVLNEMFRKRMSEGESYE